ncbi:non-ribosomal peptide synthetase/type I polyketide synthase [Xanthomonas arboricola]|uniref:non-ribosomal peptide synthetase/type I polyketide synthase n=2 Tax=Xanthomonas arboricola TaxID=56448 RepID=UPI0025B00849|nr:non-ribosomal peptide synthetase/type I polyketide synthase [Xanthomonas arboricola]MDN0207957.1 amino acid adenylation domain-containing protein [Xanthomonas arboricola pv. corylina]MDN0212427.1 amino acid adenylation domain-containing protein [Xanthomonas arboricola pv. corylina]
MLAEPQEPWFVKKWSGNNMESAKDLLCRLSSMGVEIYLDEGKLKTRAAAGCITEDVAALIRLHRDGLVTELSAQDADAAMLTPNMRRLWFAQTLSKAGAMYNVPIVVRLKGELDASRLEQALARITRRHQALRTTIAERDGDIEARLHTDELRLHSHSAPAGTDLDVEIMRLAAVLVARPFDLSCDLLIRAHLILEGPQAHVLVVCMHHIAADGWSCAVLIKELQALYNAGSTRSSGLPSLRMTSAAYARWLGSPEHLDQEQAHLEYWRGQLHDCPVVHALALDHPRPRIQSYEGRECTHAIPADIAASARRLAAQHGSTLFCVLQAALALLLSRWSNETDIVIGTSSSGRTRPGMEDMVGFFVNPLILRNHVKPTATVSGFLDATRRVLLDAFEHQDVPFERIVQELVPVRSTSHAPLFQIMLDFQAGGGEGVKLDGLRCELLPTGTLGAKYDLEITAFDGTDGLHLRWVHAAALFNTATITRLQRGFEVVLAALAADGGAHLGVVPFLAADDLDHIHCEGNGPQVAVDTRPLHARFQDIVARMPTAIAVEHGGREYSYAEVAARAEALCRHLLHGGLQPGERVGLFLQPGVDLIAAILAVHKAGAAYVPVDPAYPYERVCHILEDAATGFVLCRSPDLHRGWTAGVQVVAVDQVPSLSSQHAAPQDTPADVPHDASRAAYVLYTSGSTGRPKGAVISHAALGNYLAHALSYLRPNMRGAIVSSSIGFDATITSLLVPLLTGQRIKLLDADLDSVFKGLEEHLFDDTHAWLFKITPSHLSALGHACAQRTMSTAPHVLVIGGEQLDYAVVGLWRSRWLPGATYINEYGPTETVVGCSTFTIDEGSGELPAAGPVPIGFPICNVGMYALSNGRLVPPGTVGELHIAGAGLAEGYLNLPEVTAERFIHCSDVQSNARVYRSGDLVRLRDDGGFEFIRRVDDQVKIRGYRIETGEVESALRNLPQVREAAVVVQGDGAALKMVAFVQLHDADDTVPDVRHSLRAGLSAVLPEYMVPSLIERVDELPLTINGKVDKAALPQLQRSRDVMPGAGMARTRLEAALVVIWKDVVGQDVIGVHDNFLDAGANSLLFVKLRAEIQSRLGHALHITAFFEHPSIAALAGHLEPADSVPAAEPTASLRAPRHDADMRGSIAVIAMAGRFPDAADPDALWANLRAGHEAMAVFNHAELLANGIPAGVAAHPAFVPSAALLEDVQSFDSAYFRMTPREAEILDPQQRVLLELAVEALETAGHGDGARARHCGVFVGCGESAYLANNLLSNMGIVRDLGLAVMHANSNHYLATRIAYKLDLTGPAVNIATACSTSLVAVHQAVASLRRGECTMALAGGAGISEFGPAGYLYQEGGIESPDGHCRAFDARAQGTRGGNGAGLVLLKRLEDALRDGDPILSVIVGSALNNDGAHKAGYTAPSVHGQVAVIQAALDDAGLHADEIAYVETHGTGTPLGDPVEYRALRRVFESAGAGSCVLGTLKPNIGHLDAAAGVAGLIKAVQVVRHAEFPPCLHYAAPNPSMDMENTPFRFTERAQGWATPAGGTRRAGISAFGIGGTNVHVIIEQAPSLPARPEITARPRLLPVSARTESALEAGILALHAHLASGPAQSLADIAYTLQEGRQAHPWRAWVVAADLQEATAALQRLSQGGARHHTSGAAAAVFLFPGQGAQYMGMAQGLLDAAPHFTQAFEACRALVRQHAGIDLRAMLAADDETLRATRVAQPLVFSVCYAVAAELMSTGVLPQAMLGHSLGEYVAACVAGVFTLEDAVRLVCERSTLMDACAPGAMLAVAAAPDVTRSLIASGAVVVAAINGARSHVLSGSHDAVSAVEAVLDADGITHRRLQTSHAFHSPMMDAAAEQLRAVLSTITLRPPQRPYVSNLTGEFITAEQTCDPGYWVAHMLEPVLFEKGVRTLCSDIAAAGSVPVFIEAGPGHGLGNLVRRHADAPEVAVLSCLRHAQETTSDACHWQGAIGRMWAAGLAVAWSACGAAEQPRRVALPTYQFDRARHWLAARPPLAPAASDGTRSHDARDWFYVPQWQLVPNLAQAQGDESVAAALAGDWVVLGDDMGIAEALSRRIGGHGGVLITDGQGSDVVKDDAHIEHLLRNLAGLHSVKVACLWPLRAEAGADDQERFQMDQQRVFYPLLRLVQEINDRHPRLAVQLTIVTDRALRVTGTELMRPALAALRGFCRVVAQELPQISARLIDIDTSLLVDACQRQRMATRLWREMTCADAAPERALRGNTRWLKHFRPLSDAVPVPSPMRLRQGGHYLITGGTGRIGTTIAAWLAEQFGARVTLIGRRGPPSLPDGTMGDNIRTLRADVGDHHAFAAAFASAEQAFGPVAGVIHAAGVVEQALLPLAQTDEAACAAHFAPKATGLMNLAAILQGREVDFCLVMSSLAIELGGLGFTAYAAANAYADAFVQRKRNEGDEHWTSVAWDGWNFSAGTAPAAAHAMQPDEGLRAFAAVMGHCEQPCLINSTSDLDARFARWVGSTVDRSEGEAASGPGSDAGTPPSTEQVVTALWQDVLGIPSIDPHASFFELGGDSLIATRLVARIRARFNVPDRVFSLSEFFTHPTVAHIAARIDGLSISERTSSMRDALRATHTVEEGEF